MSVTAASSTFDWATDAVGFFNIDLRVVIENTSDYGIKLMKYEGGDWTDKRPEPDDTFEIKPFDANVKAHHYDDQGNDDGWGEESRVPGNGWAIIGDIKHTVHTVRSADKNWNTVHFSIPGYPYTSYMALWTLIYWEGRQCHFVAKLGFTNQPNDLNRKDCPLRDQNLVNSNVKLEISDRITGKLDKTLCVTFTGNDFGKFDW